jgi:hypothetical protein
MSRRSLILSGIALILLGALVLAFAGAMVLTGVRLLGFFFRFWPLTVIGAGLLFVVPPFLSRRRRGLGALFIPGLPILMTGLLLLLASVFRAWGIWGWLWPMEILAVAGGFLLAAAWLPATWLLIPAIIIGLNGLVFQFCAITGLWSWWAVLWVIEPLSVGLALLAVGVLKRLTALSITGLVLCALAGLFLVMMTTILAGGWLITLLGPGFLILLGLTMLAWGILRHRFVPRSALE